jgi:hypothetical protein
MSQTSIQETLQLIQHEFDLSNVKIGMTEEQVQKILSHFIRQLLDKNFERLLQICYRIDLGEEILKGILQESEPEKISMDLAIAIWERQKLKIKIRRMYSAE